MENTFTLTLVGHSFTIIAVDFVPITPVTVTSVYVAVGQRYDVLINANQAVGNYWFNASLSAGPCGLSNNLKPAAIFSYSGASSGNPTTPGTVPPDTHCADVLTYTPVVTRTAPVASFTPNAGDTLNTNIQINTGIAKVFWPVNGQAMNVVEQPHTVVRKER